MNENNKAILTTKQKLTLAACVVVGTAGFVVAHREKKAIIAAAREAGVNDWLREMSDNNLTIMVLTKDVAEQMFKVANEIALENRFPTVSA